MNETQTPLCPTKLQTTSQNFERTVQRRAKRFSDIVTSNRKDLSKANEFRLPQRCSVVVQDLATQRIQNYPCNNKGAKDKV